MPTELWYPTGRSRNTAKDNVVSGLEQLDLESALDELASSDDELEFMSTPRQIYETQPDELYWGFGVQQRFRQVRMRKDGTRRVSRFKLMLDEKNVHTQHIREELSAVLARLKKARFIRKESDVIVDYLTELLKHAKKQLHREGLTDGSRIEFVMCVLALWPSKTCRTTQIALSEAVRRAGLVSNQDARVDDIFIVSEPEAAASCVLEEVNSQIKVSAFHSALIRPVLSSSQAGDIIVVLDAGGGTVDAVTYSVTNSEPLRLSAEMAASSSMLLTCIIDLFLILS